MVDPELTEAGAEAAAHVEVENQDEQPDPRDAPVVDARLAALVARYGERWDDRQRDQVRAKLARGVVLAARMRRTPLSNADEPEIGFVPYRGDAQEGRERTTDDHCRR